MATRKRRRATTTTRRRKTTGRKRVRVPAHMTTTASGKRVRVRGYTRKA